MNKLKEIAGAAQAMAPLHLLIRSLDKDAKTMDDDALKAKLLSIVPEGSKKPYVEISDDMYLCPSREHFTSFASWDQTDKFVYRPEVFDCDNFAHIFWAKIMEAHLLHSDKSLRKAIAVGVTHGFFFLAEEINGRKHEDAKETNHAMNIVVTSKGSVYLFEPQTDVLYVPDPRNRYRLILI